MGWALVEFEDASSERQTRIVGLGLFSSGVWFADNTKAFFEYVREDQLTQRHERFRNRGRAYAGDAEGGTGRSRGRVARPRGQLLMCGEVLEGVGYTT